MIMPKLRQTYIFGSQWRYFCLLLGMDPRELFYSERTYRGNIQGTLYPLLIEWIRGSGSTKPTWRNLKYALYKIGEDDVADDLC